MSLPGNAGTPPPDDALVASAMRAAAVSLDGACPDLDVLGLYAERVLEDEDERAAVDAHIAGCARCQAVVASHVKSLPDPAPAAGAAPGVITGWWTGWRWLVPLASAAVVGVVAVWTGRVSSPGSDAERIAPGPAVVEFNAPAPAATPQMPGASAAQAPASDGRALRRIDADAAPANAHATSAAPSPRTVGLADATSNRERREAKSDAVASMSADAAVSSAAPPEPVALAPPPAPAAPLEAPASPAAGGGDALRATEVFAKREDRAAGSAFRASPESPRWRVREGRVERSSDNGGTWVHVALPTAEPMASVVVRNDGTVVATSTEGHVWTSRDRGTTWSRTP